MKKNSKHRSLPEKTLIIFFLLLAGSGVITLILVLAIPSEPRNRIFLAYSLPRITAAAGVLLGSLYFSALVVKALRQRDWAKRLSEKFFGQKSNTVLLRLALLGALAGFIGTFLPSYRLGYLGGYWEQLRPVLIWIGAAGLLTLLFMFVNRGRAGFISIYSSNEATFRTWVICLVTGLLLWGLVAISGLGIRLPEDHWYGAGVPILVLQVFFALGIGIILWRYERNVSRSRKRLSLDLLLFLSIWLVSAVLWAREPLRPSFFMIGPTQPNNAYYPFSDSAFFDAASQYALIGQGIMNGEIFDRPGYIAWLTYLHMFIGQDYESLAALQSAVFGVLPAIVFLIGTAIYSRPLGVVAAAITAFRGANSIAASNMIDLASPKMFLTDFPTAIGMALFTLFVVRWLKGPEQRLHNALAAGCVLGLTILLRTNALLILPGALLFAFLLIYQKAQQAGTTRVSELNNRSGLWKKWSLGALLLTAGMIAATLPWDLRNYTRGAPMFYLYFVRIQAVVEERYRLPLPEIPFADPWNSRALEVPAKKSLLTIPPFPATGVRFQTESQTRACNSLACSIPNHLLHNLVTSILIFPTSPQLNDLSNTVKLGPPLWRPDWDGSGLGPVVISLGALNLSFISLGIGVSWQRLRWLGLTPFAIYLFYILSNTLALTSGGRYLVPVDWVVVLYFSLGAMLLLQWATTLLGRSRISPMRQVEENMAPDPFRLWALLARIFIIFTLGLLVPLSELIFPRRFPVDPAPESMLALLHDEHRQALVHLAGLDPGTGVEAFLQNNSEAELLLGRGLYPRFIRSDFPNFAFTLIGPSGTSSIVLPSGTLASLPHAADVLVLGCQRPEYVEAFAVFVLDDPGGSYLSPLPVPFEC